MSTERSGIDPYKGDIGDAGSSGIKPDPGDITRGMKTGGSPAYIPIYYTPWI